MENALELSILMPCLNEELTLGKSIEMAQKYIKKSGICAEILIADNGSTDRSIEIAEKMGARVVSIVEKGYGNALRGGIKAATGKYIIMGDSDATYDFEHLDLFMEKLREGYPLVMGNRYQGGIAKGAMPFSHQYIGVPILSMIARKAYHVKVGDFHCGLRGMNTKVAQEIEFESTGMEFATEMIYQFAKKGEKIAEIPTVLMKGDKERRPHLRSIRDGMRHLKYILRSAGKK